MYGVPETKGTVMSKAVAAAIASLPEGFTIQPIEVSKIALQLDKTNKYGNNASAVIKDIMATRGWTGLFIGYFGIQYRQTSWTAAYFATLDFFSQQSKAVVPSDWKMTQNLVGGFAAGMFGAVFNTPGDVIRSAQQKSVMAATPVKHAFSPGLVMTGISNFFAMGSKIAAEKGIGGLYSGFAFKAIHLGGSGALLAMLIPMFKVHLISLRLRSACFHCIIPLPCHPIAPTAGDSILSPRVRRACSASSKRGVGFGRIFLLCRRDSHVAYARRR